MASRKTADAPVAKILAYKGFSSKLMCRDHQFEIGKSYEVEGAIRACKNGFHACEYPLAVFDYYQPADSRYALVELEGDTDVDGDKTAARKITLIRELTIREMVEASVAYTMARATVEEGATASGDQGAATASGIRGAATASGTRGAATASGYQGKAQGKDGCALFLVERDIYTGAIKAVWAGVAGRDGIKADTFYSLVDGAPVEVK